MADKQSPTPTPADAPRRVEAILEEAVRRGASDLHLEPTAEGYEIRLRVDGLLETVSRVDAAAGRMLVTRLMVMAQLLTYRLDIPQEGRLIAPPAPAPGSLGAPGAHGAHGLPGVPLREMELRLAVIPTTQGLRAAVRLPAELTQPRRLEDLGLPAPTLDGLRTFASASAGMMLLTGPAGSGKTTAIYALLSHLKEHSPGLSIISLEDPVERDLPGVTQIEVAAHGQLTYERALRSLLRQDPQVLALGEIRDAATASIAVQAALSGHRLVSTLHAGSPGAAIMRLVEMGLEPYQVASSVFGVASLRLLRKTRPSGGYQGRAPVAEITLMDAPLRQMVLDRRDGPTIDATLAARPGHVTLAAAAARMVEAGVTDAAEVRRVLGV